MDPFVELSHKGVKYKTRVIKEGGRKPIWNEIICIPLDTMSDEILVRCFDEDILMDDFVGEEKFEAFEFLKQEDPTSLFKNWFTLKY